MRSATIAAPAASSTPPAYRRKRANTPSGMVQLHRKRRDWDRSRLARSTRAVEPEPVDADAAQRVAALIYTSGTTGLPKGVMLTHRNLLFVAAVSASIRSLTPEDRLYGVLPMSHAVGLSVVLLGSLAERRDTVFGVALRSGSNSGYVGKGAADGRLGRALDVLLFADYAKLKGLQSLKFPGLRIISSSGAPLQPALKAQVESLFGMALHNGYGVTECSPNISQAVVGERRTDTSVGRILPGVEVQLVGLRSKASGQMEKSANCGCAVPMS